MLEGRINLLQKSNPLGRLIYSVIANMIIGTVIAISLRRPSIVQGFVTIKQLGFQLPAKRIIIAVVVAALMGFALFAIQRSVSLNSIVVLNVFLQTLPTSIAEVVVCWTVVGTAFESIFKYTSKKVTSTILAATISTTLFGIYHFAHSPSFNQPNMVLFMMYPGILTSMVYFVERDICAAKCSIIFRHNLVL